MTNTTEARRLADDLSDDADQGQAHIPSLRKSASMLRALADENERMREALSACIALHGDIGEILFSASGMPMVDRMNAATSAAREALK